jgi:hypothetical protein
MPLKYLDLAASNQLQEQPETLNHKAENHQGNAGSIFMPRAYVRQQTGHGDHFGWTSCDSDSDATIRMHETAV